VSWFEYEGQCPGGTAITGRIEAENHEAATQILTEVMRVRLGDIREVKPAAPRAPIRDADFIFFNEQLASLASAGLALDEGLEQLARDIKSRRLRRFIEDVVADLRHGESIEQAIGKHEAQLPALYSRALRAGVQSGQLAGTLLGLNQHFRLMGQTRQILWEILSYPILLFVVGLTIVSLFFMKLVPQMAEIFSDFGTRLPWPTVLLIAVADAFPMILVVLAILVAGIAVGWQLLRMSPAGRSVRERIVGHLPIVGRIYRASLISRFVRSVATSVQAGITLPEALRLAGGVTGSPGLSVDAERVAGAVEQGQAVFTSVQTCRWIPALFGYAVQVAIGRDILTSSLMHLSEAYESQAAHAQSMLRVLLFPVVVVVVGGLIAFGVVGLFLPLVSLVNVVSG